MKTLVLTLVAAAALGLATPALAHNGAPRGAAIEPVSLQMQDFSSHHRHWRRHHWRHHYARYCDTFWRHGRRITVCGR